MREFAMTKGSMFVAGVAAALVAYPFIMRLFITAIQPKRLEMAQLGNDLVKSNSLSLENKKIIIAMLREAFDSSVALRMAISFPIYVTNCVFKRTTGRPLPTEQDADKFQRFVLLFFISVFGANPIFGVICAVEGILCLILIAVCKRFIQKTTDVSSVFKNAVRSLLSMVVGAELKGFRGLSMRT